LDDGVRLSPFWRNLGILAIVAVLIVALNQETSLATASTLLRFAFFIVIGVVAYFFWRDTGRREIETWPSTRSTIFYCAVGLFVVDLGWYFTVGLAGRDFLVFVVVAAVCAYVCIRTWRDQRIYS
jgi:hypothetical protein